MYSANLKQKVLSLVLTIVALAVGQAAWADGPSNIELSTTISGGSLAIYSNEACTEVFDADVAAGATVYIKATPDAGYTAIGVTITAEEANTSAAVAVTAVSGTLNVYQFTMPANGNGVTVDATFATPAQQQVSYVDENYETQTVNAYVLDETMGVLAGGFYVVPNGLTLDHGINSDGTSGSVNIIIPDGKTLVCGTADNPLSGYAFSMGCALSFYGQTNATGKLAINATSQGVGASGRITVAHLDVDAICGSYGLSVGNGCIFAGHQTNGNTVTVRCNGDGIGGGSSSVTIKNYDVDIISGSSSYGSAFGISCGGGVTIEGIATGDKVNTVTVRSNGGGINGGNSNVIIKYCDVDIVCESSNAIGCGNSVTITGRADGSNAIKLHSNNGAINNTKTVTIQYCDVDIVCESSGSAIGCGGGVTIEGIATGDKVNTANIRSAYTGIQNGNSVTISYCNVEVTGTTKTNDIYDSCAGSGISCSGGVTITGRTDGNNTVKVRCGGNDSGSYGISGGINAVTISHCDVDIVNEGGYGICSAYNVTITGGQVDITGGTGRYGIDTGAGNIILSWTSATDYFKVNSYHVDSGNVKTADGQRFVAYDGETGPAATAIVSGASNDSNPTFTIDAIGGKTLRPLIGHYVSVPEHVAITGKTADFTIGTTSYYICNADENIELSFDLPESYVVFYSYNDGTEDHDLSGNTFTMPANDVTVSATFYPAFVLLQERLDASSTDADNPTLITLDRDYLANSTDSRLSVPIGHHVILDLNGYKIDRRLTEAKSEGNVIYVRGRASLVIRDSQGGGQITGGYVTNGSGGGIASTGNTSVTLEGGTICGNQSNNHAGGVFVGGTFTMTGGSITDNMCTGNGGGSAIYTNGGIINISGGTITGNKGKNAIYLTGTGGHLNVSGTYTLSGNTKADGTTAAPDIMLNDLVITISGALSPANPATVAQEGSTIDPVITSGWGTYMSGANAADCFEPFATDKVCFVYNNEVNLNTQAVLDELLSSRYAVTLSDDITATGTEGVSYNGTEYYSAGTDITLAYNGTIPEGYRFLGFAVDDTLIDGDTFTMPEQNVAVTAVMQGRYTFNSTTGELTLNWGEFNKDNSWGNDFTKSEVTSVTATDEVSFTGDCSELFFLFRNCTSMDLGNVNTDNLTSCYYMFYGCSNLTSLDLSDWNAENVTDMSCMFEGCSNLSSLNISGWNTANVILMSNMFTGCKALTSLDLTTFNTAKVVDMGSMFEECSGLTSLDLSSFNTGDVTYMSSIFDSCSGLTSLDLSGWDTGNVIYMRAMFNGCSGLTSLDLSGWDTGNVNDMEEMFCGCEGLTTIFVGTGWNTENIDIYNTGMVFDGCDNLVGGMGTDYDQNHIDVQYARIDKGEDEPGYLTGVFALTLAEDVTVTTAATLTHDYTNLYKAGATITLAYSGTVPDGCYYRFSVNGMPIAGNTFEMPFEYTEVGVEVIAFETVSTTYVDADGNTQTVNAIPLDETLTTLPAGTYVVNSNFEYPFYTDVTTLGDVTLILSDGCEMCFECGNLICGGNLTIYRQTEGTGELSIHSSGYDCKGISIPEGKNFNQYGGFVNILDATTAVSATNVTIGGGRLFVDGCTYGISASDVTVTGGTIDVRSPEHCIGATTVTISGGYVGVYNNSDKVGINAGTITITGGTVVADSYEGIGINAGTINFTGGNVYVPGAFTASNLNLGWTSGSDSFWVGSYNYETCVVKIADGQAFTDSNDDDIIFSGTLDEDQRDCIQDITLIPYCVTVDYVDADGNTQTTAATPLSDTMTTLAAGTYVVNSDIYHEGLTTTGDVTLILADGKTMEVDAGIGNAISCGGNLTIYGQTLGTGKIYISGNCNGISLNRKNYNQYGGIVEINISMVSHGIAAPTVTLGGGSLNISGEPINGINATTVTFTGGSVNISSVNNVGIYCSNLNLGWTKPTDSFYVNSYNWSGCDVKIAEGQAFTDGYNIYSGTLDDNQRYNIQNSNLWPYKAIILADDADNTDAINEWNGGKAEVTLQGRTLYKNGTWNTLCLPFDMELSESVLDGADVRALSSTSLSNGTLSLNFSAQGDVTRLTAGTPYIIRWASGENLVNPVFERVTISDAGTTTETDCVDFIGTYAPINFTEDDATKLFVGADNKLYYPLSGAKVNACRGYFQLKNGLTMSDNSEVKSCVLEFGDDATAIVSPLGETEEGAAIFNLAGQKLDKMQKGINIVGGRKVLVK